MASPEPTELTIGEVVRFLAPNCWKSEAEIECPSWPPDVFAIVATLLDRSAGYRVAVSADWPPKPQTPKDWIWAEKMESEELSWASWMREVGIAWRRSAVSQPPQLPQPVLDWWAELVSNASISVSRLSGHLPCCRALLQLSAAADAACEFVGSLAVPYEENLESPSFHEAAQSTLLRSEGGASLCRTIHPTRARVLPKFRTSQKGLTLRSFSLNICLCPTGEVEPLWNNVPLDRDDSQHSLNLLILPWPTEVSPQSFRPLPDESHGAQLADGFGLFRLETPESEELTTRLSDDLRAILKSATDKVGRIDAIVLPEGALTYGQFDALQPIAFEYRSVLISGICQSSGTSPQGTNSVKMAFPSSKSGVEQFKHHRWQLDDAQIATYGLAAQLNPALKWWEGIAIRDRQLNFFALEEWLTMSVLICEDLARQDPISQILRTVGPNLVIALLMDGPQLKTRWPNRYAMVLADDPGCAVLSVTSIGMCNLSRPLHHQQPSRVIALWKDDKNGAVEIELPQNADALVLTLYNDEITEYSADGRCDDYKSTAVYLGGIHPIRCQHVQKN